VNLVASFDVGRRPGSDFSCDDSDVGHPGQPTRSIKFRGSFFAML
jgi:hypothetical protein